MPAWLVSPVLRWAVVGIAAVGLIGLLRIETLARAAAEDRATAATAALAGRDKAIKALEATAADVATRTAQLQPVRRAIDAAPPTNACASSPAVRALLDGLRRRQASPDSRSAVPVIVPGRATPTDRP